MSERRNQAESSIESVNELGGIRIKCRKLTMESGENLGLELAKGKKIKLSGTGTATAPLLHPFIGKLKDGLAKDVRSLLKAAGAK